MLQYCLSSKTKQSLSQTSVNPQTLHEHIAQVQFLLTTINTSELSVTTTDGIPHLTNRQNEQPNGASESHPTVSSAQPLEDIPSVMSDMLPVVSEMLPVAGDLSVMGEMPCLPSTALTVPLMQLTFTQPTVTAHVTPSTHTVSPSYNVTSLPKLTIPTFNGDPLSWQSFWDCFVAVVHSNHTLTGVQKLSYLRA